MIYKLGRTARTHDPRIPHMSALLGGKKHLPIIPSEMDYTTGMSQDLGMMLNDELGCCTCAGLGHGIQVWSFNASGVMLTIPDSDVELLYENACGFDPNAGPPGANPTDQGGNEQAVLTYAMQQGIPVSDDGQVVNHVAAFVEIDPRNVEDVKRGIFDCGFVYIGFEVPQYLLPADGSPPPTTWDVDDNADNTIIGGHAVILPAYFKDGSYRVISWGSSAYTMTQAFFDAFVDETYGLGDATWIKSTGLSPCGLSLPQLEAQMLAFSYPFTQTQQA